MKKAYPLQPRVPVCAIDYEGNLNPQQLEAVRAPDGPALVIAGAGSGKTRVVTYRVAYLLEKGVPPESILLLTFTKKAAEEMLRRAAALVSAEVGRIWGGTFHHVGNLILRAHAPLLGLKETYTILDREDSRVLMDSAVREEGIDVKAHRFPKGHVLQEVLSYGRNAGLPTPAALELKAGHFLPLLDQIEKVFRRYERRKRALDYVDFDDLLVKFNELLKHPEIAERYGRRFRYILVDEYQDTNLVQAAIVDKLAAVHGNVMVVGDDSQSIYSFRGAAFQNIRDFPRRYPACRIYTVETNYRSTPEVLALTNRVLEGAEAAFRKKLQAVRKGGALPVLVHPFDVYAQADFVAQRILELRDEGVNLGEMAVLYRSHYHSMEIQLELNRRDIPFTIRSGLRFFEQAHIKDVLSYLKFVENPRDEIAWKRCLQIIPRVGPKSAQTIWEALAASADSFSALGDPAREDDLLASARVGWRSFVAAALNLRDSASRGPADLIGRVMESDYQDYLKATYPNHERRIEDIRQLVNYAQRYRELEEFLSDLAMTGGVTGEEIRTGRDDESVVLTTVHQAKGLEWRVVFLVWLAEGKFPPASSFADAEAMEEERRLFYVATTRCRDELYLCHPVSVRQRGGPDVVLRPSRYLQELPEDLYDEWDLLDV
jgi:DNA helicase-2/ATP-dependent DNA helicase PcrA